MINAPDGSTASFDSERTRMLYAGIDGVADPCACPGCRNYRAAFRIDYLDSGLVAACAEIGIDPSKAFETTALNVGDSGSLFYTPVFPFFGSIVREPPGKAGSSSWWFFARQVNGTARVAAGVVAIYFSVTLPWVLPEPNPYTG